MSAIYIYTYRSPAVRKALTLIPLIPFFDEDRVSCRDLDVARLLGALVGTLLVVAVLIGPADLVPVGDEGPGQAHGGGGEGAAPDPEEEADDDHEDVLGAILEGAEPERSGLSGGDLAATEEHRPGDHRGAGVVVEGEYRGDDAVHGDEPGGSVEAGEGVVVGGGGSDGVGNEHGVAGVERDAGTGVGVGGEEGEHGE
ncbi:unnamed protein product [Musa acuminata subsp. malaccensis]|uniref:(wild Malaysian banana) hypothetical protein n=1 Tax=Musa acuminata subsp. malaccensis TaxID=214687 RepID=A0A8D6ZIN6_MUSAM|nr:unnamed protein product [Musa acuminata subsp. malaccensis]